jgi:uncharacterized membrane protein YgdD (TMEM256/DUF423 family)
VSKFHVIHSKMLSNRNIWLSFAGLLGTTGVMLGAYAAHGVPQANAASALERAANYQLLHALALICAIQLQGRLVGLSRWAFFIGTFLFSGGICAKYILHVEAAARIAPTGGILLMLGWLMLGLAGMAKYR